MKVKNWKKLKQQAKVWYEVALPAAFIIGLVMLARLSGILQSLELETFDNFLSLRPPEAVDTRVLIVGIDEDDINLLGGFPVPDDHLAKMLKILQTYKPRVIGLDIFKDPTSNPHRAELDQAFREIPDIIGTEVALNPEETLNVKPPPELPPDRLGFADVVVDFDGKLRRSLLASRTFKEELKYSLPLRLAQVYLRSKGMGFHHGTRSSDPISFGSVELPRFLPNSGGYVRADARGNQVLLNFRSNRQPFRTVSLRDVLTEKVEPSWVRDRIVLVGMTASSVKDKYITSAVKRTLYTSIFQHKASSNQYQWLYGVEIHAHATSQIISKVLDKRPLISVWPTHWEYLWILVWGSLGIALGLSLQSPWKILLNIGIANICLVGICYIFLVLGCWIPVVPTLLALAGAGLTTSFFYRDLRSLLEQRSLTLQRSFEAIHNGPLQNLAAILRSIDEEDLSPERVRSQLQELNQELRRVYDSLKQEMLSQDDSLYLEGDAVLNLQTPMAELLHEVAEITLRRNFQGFTTIKTYIPPNFEPLEECHLSSVQKRGLCLFLQESLCNIGKHAIGATRLEIVCMRKHGWYSIQIVDNGVGNNLSYNYTVGGQGTNQAQELARQLRGKFRRLPNNPKGIICELAWPIAKKW